MVKDYYKILGLNHEASEAEVKKAFRVLAFKLHPDRNEGDKEAEGLFIEVHEAYDTLSNLEKRKLYDLKINNNPFYQSFFEQAKQDIQYYFLVHCDKTEVLLNEELKITFTYSGEGRIFRKPSFINFFLTGAPFVSFRNVTVSGIEIKETSLTYIIAPMLEGVLKIEEAYIKIANKPYATQPLLIIVKENKCHFAKNKKADGISLKYIMNFEAEGGSDHRRTYKNTNHTVLIPRSHYAYVYHRICTSMKIIFFIWGFILGWKIDVLPLISGLCGLAFGGISGNILYLLVGVKPKFYFAKKYALVQQYLGRGYRSGTETGSAMLNSEAVYFITSLLS